MKHYYYRVVINAEDGFYVQYDGIASYQEAIRKCERVMATCGEGQNVFIETYTLDDWS
jgi:hypothetical protein